MKACPNCDAEWIATEIMGVARRGGGYRVLCHACNHEWDDRVASHGERETARRKARRAATLSDIEVTGVVDPARYSDKAVAVIEVPAGWDEDLSQAEMDDLHQHAEETLGMKVMVLVGARLARIEDG